MGMRPVAKALLFVFTVFVAFALALGTSGTAAAAQGAPNWASGDHWTFNVTGGGSPGSIEWVVHEQTSLTVGTTSYSTWHVTESTTTTSGSTSVTTVAESWLTTSGLAEVKDFSSLPIFGNITVTFDPPMPLLKFPLSPGDVWNGTTTETTTTALGTISAHTTYSGQVLGEIRVTVPAGTFTAAEVRVPATGNPYTLYYYSDAVGFFVQVQAFNGQGAATTTQSLTSYSYTGNLLLFIVIGIVLLAVVAIAALLLLRRRHRPQRVPYPAPYPPPNQPPTPPPPQPPQGPPPGGP